MKIEITGFVLATLCILPSLSETGISTNSLSTIKTTQNSTTPEYLNTTKIYENSTEASLEQGEEERKEKEKQQEKKLREKFEKEERKYCDKRIKNLEENIHDMLANLYLSASKKMELDVALALLRKAVSNTNVDVKEFAYKEAFRISVRALP